MADMVTVKVEGMDRLQAALRTLGKKCSDRRPLMGTISRLMKDEVEENFEQEGRPKWTPLAKSTIKERAKKGHWPGQILKIKGRLVNSIIDSSDNDRAIVGTNVKYAARHQFGGTFQVAARKGKVRLRTDTKGELLRQGQNGKLAVFAKAGHKRAVERNYTASDHTVTTPARPFLKLTEGGISKIERAVVNYLSGA